MFVDVPVNYEEGSFQVRKRFIFVDYLYEGGGGGLTRLFKALKWSSSLFYHQHISALRLFFCSFPYILVEKLISSIFTHNPINSVEICRFQFKKANVAQIGSPLKNWVQANDHIYPL